MNGETTQLSFNFDPEGVTVASSNGGPAVILTEKEFIPTTIYLDLLDITLVFTLKIFSKSLLSRDIK